MQVARAINKQSPTCQAQVLAVLQARQLLHQAGEVLGRLLHLQTPVGKLGPIPQRLAGQAMIQGG